MGGFEKAFISIQIPITAIITASLDLVKIVMTKGNNSQSFERMEERENQKYSKITLWLCD